MQTYLVTVLFKCDTENINKNKLYFKNQERKNLSVCYTKIFINLYLFEICDGLNIKTMTLVLF